MQSMADVYENLQEKMHDVDKTMWVSVSEFCTLNPKTNLWHLAR